MAEPDLLSFAIWSGLSIVVIVVTGVVYTSFLRGKKREKPSS